MIKPLQVGCKLPVPRRGGELLNDTTHYLASGVNPPQFATGVLDSVSYRVTIATLLDGCTFVAQGLPMLRAHGTFGKIVDADGNTTPNVAQVVIE